jgi:hypothetical protein
VSPESAPTTRSARPDEPTTQPGDPEPTLEPAWLAGQAVTCGDELFFSTALLLQPGFEEEATDPAALALRNILAQPRARVMWAAPSVGWHRVGQTATKVQFVAVAFETGKPWVVGFEARDASWQVTTQGVCQGEARRPVGFGRADWWLDPRFGAPRDDDQLVHAVLMERSCASGRSPEGRIAPPSIAYFERAIVVTMSVRHRPGGQDCEGNPKFPFELTLDQAIGDRRLLDGGVFPPRSVDAPQD